MHRILTNWTWFRFLRLGIGIFIIVHGIGGKDTSMLIMGVLFTLLPLFDFGCTGGSCAVSNSCSTTKNKSQLKNIHNELD